MTNVADKTCVFHRGLQGYRGEANNMVIQKGKNEEKGKKNGSISVSGQLPTYPSPNPTLTLTCCQLTVVELGEGWVGSCPDTDIDPKKLLRVVLFVSKVFHLDKAGIILFPPLKITGLSS